MSEPTVLGLRTRRIVVDLHTPFVTALRSTGSVQTLLVEVVDSDGVRGWGEAPQVWRVTGDSVAGAEACLQGPLRDAVLDRPAEPAVLAGPIAGAVVGNRSAKSALDVALHDLAARRTGRSMTAQLGGVQPEPVVLTDVTVSAGSAAEMARAAFDRVADGFDAVKLKVGTQPDDPAAEVARVAAVRAAVGPDVQLRLDANQGWDARSAVRIVTDLEDAGAAVAYVEQPVPAHDVLGLAHVTARVETPVMADESCFDLVDLVELVRARAADLVNVKLAKCGGLTPALELCDLARRHGLGVAVGSMMESHVGVAAAGALAAAAVGAEDRADLDAGWWAARSPYVGGPVYDGPRLLLGDGPGLGFTGFAGPAGPGADAEPGSPSGPGWSADRGDRR